MNARLGNISVKQLSLSINKPTHPGIGVLCLRPSSPYCTVSITKVRQGLRTLPRSVFLHGNPLVSSVMWETNLND